MRKNLLLVLLSVIVLICIIGSCNGKVQHLKLSAGDNTNLKKFTTRRYDKNHRRLMANTNIVIASNKKPQWQGTACIVGGALAHLTLGTVYCWGNFLSYAPKSLRFFDGIDKIGAQPDALYVIPFAILAQAMAVPWGPALIKAIGSRKTLLFGSWMTALSVYLASYQTKLSNFIWLYSILFGTGVGLAYTAPMTAGWKWMPEKKGLVTGGILTGFGAGGFFFSLIGSHFINPKKLEMTNNGRFPDEVYDNFPPALRKLSMIYAGLSLLGSLLVREPVQQPISVSVANSNDVKKESVADILPGLTVKEALKTSQFWLLWIMVISSATAGLNTASVYKQFAATSIILKGDGYQALVGGLGALFNGGGRLFWGALTDKIGFKKSFAFLTIFQAFSMGIYTFSSSSKLAFIVNTCMLFLCLAGNLALLPPAAQRLFGPNSGATIYGLIFSAVGMASIFGGLLTKALVSSIGWTGLFKVLSLMSILATMLVSRLQPLEGKTYSSV